MSIAQCAAAAVAVFPADTVQTPAGTLTLPVAMVAIGGAESNWDTTAQGDYGLSGPACHGYTSWGWLQVHSVHAAYLQGVTGGTNPCDWATWLYNPAHCAQAALAIYKGSGLSAWTTYNDGRWAQHIAQAKQAVSAATQAAAVSPQSLPSGGGSFSANHAILWLTAAGVGLSVVSTYEGYQRIVQKHGHSAPLGLGR